MATRNYNPLQWTFSFGGVPIIGYAKGTFLKVERMTDRNSSDVGAGGDVVRVQSNDKRGRITITLQRASASNDYLSSIAQADELGLTANAGVKSAFVKDLNGTTSAGGSSAWIVKKPDVEGAVEASDVEWIIEVAQMEYFVGGQLV